MRVEVFSRLLDELVRIGFSGRLSYHFYNEPLLRHDLEMLVSQVSDRLPEAYQLLFTNGVLLTNKRYHSLLEAGLDSFVVTSHNNKLLPEREFQKVILPTELILTNRGGTMFTLDKSLDRPCYAPDEMLIVTNDANRKVKKKSLMVWGLILLIVGLSPLPLLTAVIIDVR